MDFILARACRRQHIYTQVGKRDRAEEQGPGHIHVQQSLPKSLLVFLNNRLGHNPHSWYLHTEGSSHLMVFSLRCCRGTFLSLPISSSSIARTESILHVWLCPLVLSPTQQDASVWLTRTQTLCWLGTQADERSSSSSRCCKEIPGPALSHLKWEGPHSCRLGVLEQTTFSK
jgi:hypothetical protein